MSLPNFEYLCNRMETTSYNLVTLIVFAVALLNAAVNLTCGLLLL